MKALIREIVLQDRSLDREVPAALFRTLDQRNFDDFTLKWRPALKAPMSGAAQDSHWEWVEKSLEAQRILGRDTFAVECGGETQGMMLVDVGFSRLEPQRGRELVYVELVATAPWNRADLVASPRYKGVGRALIGTAISLSAELGFNGRIGLHSLPQSEPWYRAAGGFTDVGFDANKQMHYFEMTSDDALAFVSD